VVALKEISDFPLAQFGIAKFPSGCGPAQNELSALLRAVLRTLVSEEQLLQTMFFINGRSSYVEVVSTPYIF
jgi:hypothetical protein